MRRPCYKEMRSRRTRFLWAEHIEILGQRIANQILDRIDDSLEQMEIGVEEVVFFQGIKQTVVVWWRLKRYFVKQMDKADAELVAAQTMLNEIDVDFLVQRCMETGWPRGEGVEIRQYIANARRLLQNE